MKNRRQIYILISLLKEMKNQTIVSMSPVFDNRDQEIKHYSTVVGTRNEAGEYKVEDLGEVKLDELAGFVKSYKRSKFVGVMPNHQVFTRYVRLPAATPENLVKMVGFEAQSIPFPMSEVLWGYNQFSSASSTKKGEYEVRLIALKKDTAEKYFPFRLDMLTDSVDGIAKLYQRRIVQSAKLIALVNCDERTTNVVFADSDFGRFSRAVPLSIFAPIREKLDKGESEEQYRKNEAIRLYADITRTNIFAEKQMKLSGAEFWATSKGVEKALSAKMKITYKSPAEELSMHSSNLRHPLIINEDGITPTYALAGLVSWPDGVNMLPVAKNPIDEIRAEFGRKMIELGESLVRFGKANAGYARINRG